MNCEEVLREIQGSAPALYFLLATAFAALAWQWIEDAKRDRVCKRCRHCQAELLGTPPPPPPKSGVGQ